MANAYATIASGGMRNRPIAIEKVTFPDGHTENLGKPRRHRAFTDGVTAKATDIMEQNIKSGTGTKANIGCPAAGKTGTTDNHTDAWFVGYTPNLSTAVWVGFPKRRVEMYPPVTPISVAGGTYPSEIWGRYMKAVKRGCGGFPEPRTPFKAAPFFGAYSATGAPGGPADEAGYGVTPPTGGAGTDGATDGTGGTDTGANGGTTPGNNGNSTGTGNGGGNANGNGNFDPDLYETPPQGAPDTQGTGGAGQ
jgi:penicillin-binding protein 1A